MSSILTNNSAMVALDTLRGINKNLASVQSEISTGKKINSSTDNAAIWSIATVMQSDVESYSQLTDSLNLGSATVGTARDAANEVTELLKSAKSAIVAANDASVTDADRAKYQTDLNEFREGIASIVDAASINGQNLLKAGDDISVLSSLNRDTDGNVTPGTIGVARQDLTTGDAITGGSVSNSDPTGATLSNGTVAENGGTQTITIASGTTESATTYEFTVAGEDVSYEAAAGLDQDAIAAGMKVAVDAAIADAGLSGTLTTGVSGGVLTFTNSAAANGNANDVTVGAITATSASVAAGGLNALADLDISTTDGASTALNTIDTLLQTAIDATAFFGSKQNRIDNQNEFVTTLSDSLKTGIGALTDANLEEASARLQSLQVQQQLGVQALSIANQAPQSLLALFQ
ncbi:flagellin [Litorimonas haliclonae]|uniref:flagellin N-terminal helical domain-containing protein n=1 Tax=Litorimonas haliclonae TaxID=2081977 RepID=UPI0039EE4160